MTTNASNLKLALREIWHSLPEETIRTSVVDFRKWLNACMKADGAHALHALGICWSKANFSFDFVDEWRLYL